MIHALGSLTSLIRLRAFLESEALLFLKPLFLLRSKTSTTDDINLHFFDSLSIWIQPKGANVEKLEDLTDCDELGGTQKSNSFVE